MIIHGNEIMEPEELTQVGLVFDETWAAVSNTVGEGNSELRTALASIILRLAHLRQLGPDQMKATALRLFRCEPIETRAAGPHYPSSFANEATDHSASAAIAAPT
jgi:hypothetical protein